MNKRLLPLYGLMHIAKNLKKIIVFLDGLIEWTGLNLALTNKQKKILSKNRHFKAKHKGEAAFVIATGPSLKKQNIDSLGDFVTFSVNAFFKHKCIKKWQPNYYSLLDKNLLDSDDRSLDDFYKEIRGVVDKTTFFLPLYRGYDFNNERRAIKNKVFYIAHAGSLNLGLELDKIVPTFDGVAAFSLAQAIYMECNPIYLIGFDHDYLANRGIDHHFFEGGTIKDHKLTNVPLLDRNPYDYEMERNLKLWKSYRWLKKVAEKKGIKIFNATDGGYLDVFERIQFERIPELNK